MENLKILDNTFAVLELAVMHSPHPLTLGEFMRSTRLSKSTCSRLIRFLESKGYLEHAGSRLGYRAGVRAQALGNNMRYNPEFLRIAKPMCLKAAAELHSSAVISIMRNNHLYYLVHENFSSVKDMGIQQVAYQSLCNTASGFVLLAYSDAETRKYAFDHIIYINGYHLVMDNCFPNMDFFEVLDKVKSDGFASFITPIWGVSAVPVMIDGKCYAAFASTVPSVEATEETQAEAVELLQKFSGYISRHVNTELIC